MLSTEKHGQFHCSLKFLTYINMLLQHYLGHEKPPFLTYNPEQFYAAIL